MMTLKIFHFCFGNKMIMSCQNVFRFLVKIIVLVSDVLSTRSSGEKLPGPFFVGNYMSSMYGREIFPSIIFKRLTSIPLLDLGKKCEQVFKVDQ